MPTARNRSKDSRQFRTGTRYNRIALPQTQTSFLRPLVGDWGTCADVIGNYPNVNPLGINMKSVVTPVLNGEKYVTIMGGVVVLDKAFYDHPIDLDPSPTVNPVNRIASPSAIERNNLAWSALAKSNPSAPTMSIPTYFAELKDIPGLIKDMRGAYSTLKEFYRFFIFTPAAIRSWGNDLLRLAAKGHISWRWAIRPMLSDLTAMLRFTESVTRTMQKLEKLATEGSLRTRVNLGSETVKDPEASVIIHSNLDIWRAQRTTTTTQNRWFVSRWIAPPSFAYAHYSPWAKELYASSITYGITTYEALATLWEILPWSWFVDWFAGIGTLIAANNNTLGLTNVGSCFMCTTESKTQWNISQRGAWSTLSGVPSNSWTVKERWSQGTTLPLAPTSAPVLDASKWSILASLYVLNRKRRLRARLPY
jgi:hypothetical protein